MNKAILMGRLTKDVELKTTGNGTAVASFTLAIDRRFKNANGERLTDFIPCVAWRQTAEFVNRYFQKGSKISVVGSIQVRTYDDKNGERRYVTEVIVEEAYFTESANSQGGGDDYTRPAGPGEKFQTMDDTGLPFDL